MIFPRWATATCVSLAILFVVTAALWRMRLALPGAIDHPVFFYLAMIYGVVEGASFAIAAFACSAFFLYDPIYSFYVSNTRALGELFWFLIMALIGVKCVTELRHPSKKP